MGKITDITLQKKDPKRVNIFIDGRFAFGLSAETRFMKKLEPNKEVSGDDVKNLIETDQVERLSNKAFKFLSYRPRSEKEVRDHLIYKGRLKGIEKSETEKEQYEKSVDLAIKLLKKIGQVDDKEFARWWIEQRKRFRQRGNRIIKMELLGKGVEKDLIEELQVDSNQVSEEHLALKAAQKKAPTYKGSDDKEFKIKMGQLLARKGFDWGVVKKVVDTLIKKRLQ